MQNNPTLYNKEITADYTHWALWFGTSDNKAYTNSGDGSFAHGYGYPRVPDPKTTCMGKTWRHFVPMGNGYPYSQNIWVGYRYEIAPMGNPMDTQKKLINKNNTYNMWG